LHDERVCTVPTNSLETFSRARTLCERLADAPEYPQVMFWLATVHVVRGELPEGLEACETATPLAEARGDRPALLNWLRGTAMILVLMGRVSEARDWTDRSIDLFESCNETERTLAEL
jgi:hypothetical protein